MGELRVLDPQVGGRRRKSWSGIASTAGASLAGGQEGDRP